MQNSTLTDEERERSRTHLAEAIEALRRSCQLLEKRIDREAPVTKEAEDAWREDALQRIGAQLLEMRRLLDDSLGAPEPVSLLPPPSVDRRSYPRRVLGSIRWKYQTWRDQRRSATYSLALKFRIGAPSTVPEVEISDPSREPADDASARSIRLTLPSEVSLTLGGLESIALAIATEPTVERFTTPQGCLHGVPGGLTAQRAGTSRPSISKVLSPRCLSQSSAENDGGSQIDDAPYAFPGGRAPKVTIDLAPIAPSPARDPDHRLAVVLTEPLTGDLESLLDTLLEIASPSLSPDDLLILSLHGPAEPEPERWRRLGTTWTMLPLGSMIEPEVLIAAARWRLSAHRRILALTEKPTPALVDLLNTLEPSPHRRVLALAPPSDDLPWPFIPLRTPEKGLFLSPKASSMSERAPARDRLGLSGERPLVVAPCDLTAAQRPEDVILLADRVPELTFLLVGNGSLAREIDALREYLQIGPDRFRRLSAELCHEALSAADLILSTAALSPFPASLLAASHSRPILATDSGPGGDLTRRAGLAAPPTPGDLERLTALLRDWGAGRLPLEPPADPKPDSGTERLAELQRVLAPESSSR